MERESSSLRFQRKNVRFGYFWAVYIFNLIVITLLLTTSETSVIADDTILTSGHNQVKNNEPNPPPSFTFTGEETVRGFGYVVAPAGDVNGDNFPDIAISAPHYFDNQGRVYLYYGSSGGFLNSPALSLTGEDSASMFGQSVSTAGDINNDGFSDLIIGAPCVQNSDFCKGRVYIYMSSSSGLLTTPSHILRAETDCDQFGYSVSTAGDVNRDSYSDVIVGAFRYPSGTYQGKVYLFSGSSTGLITIPSFTITSEEDVNFGFSVSTAGDVNNDGFSDVLIGEPGKSSAPFGIGHTYIYTGSSTGLDSSHLIIINGENPGDWFGYSVNTAGDVNGDGYSDIIIGADCYPNNQCYGKTYVYNGSDNGIEIAPTFSFTGEFINSLLGYSVSTAGDVNSDGFSDIIIGAYGWGDMANGQYTGRVYLFLGGQSGLDVAPWIVLQGGDGGYFGISVNTVSYVDSYRGDDIIIGATEWNTSGRAFVYFGENIAHKTFLPIIQK